MKKFVIISFIWTLSFLSLAYVEGWRETVLILENNWEKNFLKKLNNFNNFYQIQINKPKWLNKTIGYKNEIFKNTKEWYSYKYTVNLNMDSINQFMWSLNAQWNIIFNTWWKIRNFNILLKDKFLIKWEKQWDSDKIMVKFKNINKPKSEEKSKLFDLNEFKLDFMLLKTLPFRDLEKNKTYSYNIFMPSFIKKISWIKKQKLEIKKKSYNKYIISNNLSDLNLKTIITFNWKDNITSEKISFIEFDLIQNNKRKNSIIEKIDSNKDSNQTTKNNETKTNSSNKNNDKSNKTKSEKNNTNKKDNKNSQQNKTQEENKNNNSDKDLAKDQLNNFDIWETIKNITQRQEKKKCDLLLNH